MAKPMKKAAPVSYQPPFVQAYPDASRAFEWENAAIPIGASVRDDLNSMRRKYGEFADRSNFAVDNLVNNALLNTGNIAVGLGKMAVNKAKDIGRATVYGTDDWSVGSSGPSRAGGRRSGVQFRGTHTPGYIAGPLMLANTAADFFDPFPETERTIAAAESMRTSPSLKNAGKLALHAGLAGLDWSMIGGMAEHGVEKVAQQAIKLGRY